MVNLTVFIEIAWQNIYTGAVSENPRQNESKENMILRRMYLKDLENFTHELWEGNSMGAGISFLREYGT